MLKWLWLTGLVVALDQISKQLAQALLNLHEPVAVMASLNLTLMHNPGAAFSLLADADGWQRWFFLILALLISAVLIVWLKRLDRGQRLQALALALILGGAVGNVIDRILYGYVIDFIQVYYQRWYWPTFNLADSAISVGAVLLITDSFFGVKRASVPAE